MTKAERLAQELQDALFAQPQAGPIKVSATLVTLIIEALRFPESAGTISASSNVDTERLDWLEGMTVEVRTPSVHGSRHLFYAGPVLGDGTEDPAPIREYIDRHRAADSLVRKGGNG